MYFQQISRLKANNFTFNDNFFNDELESYEFGLYDQIQNEKKPQHIKNKYADLIRTLRDFSLGKRKTYR